MGNQCLGTVFERHSDANKAIGIEVSGACIFVRVYVPS